MPGTERYVEGLNECTAPAAADWLQIADMSESADRDRKVSAALIPWTNSQSVFTRAVSNNAPAISGEWAFNANMPAAALANQRAFRWSVNDVARGYITANDTVNQLTMLAFDNGAGEGPAIIIQHNNSGTPAAGYLRLYLRNGTSRKVWFDTTGLLRAGTVDVTNANDSAGSVIGDQASSLNTKTITGPAPSAAEALQHIAEAAAAVRAFVYKAGHYNNEEFSGVIVDYAPRYGMDRDERHPAGKSLNVINALGDIMIAVNDLAQRIQAIEQGNPA